MKRSKRHQRSTLASVIVGTIVAIAALSQIPGTSQAKSPAKTPAKVQPRMSVTLPIIDARRGRRLFVTKGCFICHSVKGVGGKAAPALDATSGNGEIDVLGFVARMWKGAPLMFELQSMELGYRIELTRDEIADLAGFVGDSRAQAGFSKTEIPEVVQDWVVNQAWWKDRSLNLGDMLPEKFPDLEETRP